MFDGITSHSSTSNKAILSDRSPETGLHTTSEETEITSCNCFYTNAGSLLNKMDELRVICSQRNPYIIGITETWCSPGNTDGEVSISGMTTFRRDREVGKGGGVALYLKSNLKLHQFVTAPFSIYQNHSGKSFI